MLEQEWGIGRKELIDTAELFGTVNDPRKNSSDTTPFDFIDSSYGFLSILAQYGWIPSIVMILSVLLLCIRLISNTLKIKDTYGKMISISIATIYILQIVCNFWASFSRGILIDTPIPLVTFGVSNLIVNMMCMALVLSVYRSKNSNIGEIVTE